MISLIVWRHHFDSTGEGKGKVVAMVRVVALLRRYELLFPGRGDGQHFDTEIIRKFRMLNSCSEELPVVSF